MTVGRISFICWTVFVVMSVAFLPLVYGIYQLPVLPVAVRLSVGIVIVAVLWWGPFAYAMYLAMTATLRGDQRLLRRGVRGTATVLSARATNMVISGGVRSPYRSRVYKYRLRVTVPGRPPYETSCSVCAAGYAEGGEVDVAVSPRNPKRVTIVPGQRGRTRRPTPGVTTYGFPDGEVGASVDMSTPQASQRAPRAKLIEELTQLGRLHGQGVLTDAEFAVQKARILDEIGD